MGIRSGLLTWCRCTACLHDPSFMPMDKGHGSPSVDQDKGMLFVYLQCYFVTIATILGTGILGLPVTLSDAGIYPFLVTFILSYLLQVVQVVFITDLLQRVHALQLQELKTEKSESLPLKDLEGFASDDDASSNSDGKTKKIMEPNLYLLGYLFLGPILRYLFYLLLFLNLVTYGISYALAGSQAYGEVINTNMLYVLPVFVWVLSLLIVFAFFLVQPIVSVLTFAKGALLLGTVIVTFIVGTTVHQDIDNNFSYIGAPFLMGTVALGGVVSTMPMIYGKIKPIQHQVRNYRTAVVLAVTTCTVLNILWCWAVLDIVPQKPITCSQEMAAGSNLLHGVQKDNNTMFCTMNVSLSGSVANGEISTVPLSRVIKERYPKYSWVAWAVEVFIMVSITVSYLVMGATLHHTLGGWVDNLMDDEEKALPTSRKLGRCIEWCYSIVMRYRKRLATTLISLATFAVIYGVAGLNPKSFVAVLDRAGSLVLNLQSVFLFAFIFNSTHGTNRELQIPLPLPNWVYHLQYTIPLYFGFAVVYDIYIWIAESVSNHQNTGLNSTVT